MERKDQQQHSHDHTHYPRYYLASIDINNNNNNNNMRKKKVTPGWKSTLHATMATRARVAMPAAHQAGILIGGYYDEFHDAQEATPAQVGEYLGAAWNRYRLMALEVGMRRDLGHK